NTNPADKRLLLDAAPTATPYDVAHARFQPAFRTQIGSYGYRDLYLINLTGDVVYSVAKQADFATNIVAEGSPLAKSGLAAAYTKAAAITSPTDFAFIDFSTYAPAG